MVHKRHKAEVAMEGQFLVRQIYDDELTYNLIGAAVEILSKFHHHDLNHFTKFYSFKRYRTCCVPCDEKRKFTAG